MPATTYIKGQVQIVPPSGSRFNSISPNWCDKTTWYSASIRHENTTLIDSGDHQTYNLAIPHVIIDVTHGKLTHETKLVPTHGIIVKVNNVEKAENPPGTTDGNFNVDYDNGSVIFNSMLMGTETVTMTHNEANGSVWTVQPDDGKQLRLTGVELQFSNDGILYDSVIFAVWAEVGKFPPFEPYREINGGPYPDGTMLSVGDPVIYKTIMDIVNEANCAYPIIPALGDGTNNWRGLKTPVIIFRWDYVMTTDLRSDWGMELRISLENDIVNGGWWAAATLYHISEELPE